MPKAFQFKLQRVLEYREQLEESAKNALAKARNDYREQVARVEGLKHSLKQHLDAMSGKKNVSSAELWLWRNYRERLEFDIKQGEHKLKELATEVDKRRREVVARSKDRKLLEKLKSNQALAFAQEEGRKEQRDLDEMATLRYGHRGV
jgi:flagellar FliJ protein